MMYFVFSELVRGQIRRHLFPFFLFYSSYGFRKNTHFLLMPQPIPMLLALRVLVVRNLQSLHLIKLTN